MTVRSRASLAITIAALLFLYVPLVVVVLFSFHNTGSLSLPFTGFSLQWYDFVLNDPGDADSHLTAIDDRLKKLGLPSVLAAYCAGDVVALIKRDAESIRATQRELEGRHR